MGTSTTRLTKAHEALRLALLWARAGRDTPEGPAIPGLSLTAIHDFRGMSLCAPPCR